MLSLKTIQQQIVDRVLGEDVNYIRYELVVPDSVDIDDIARDLRKTRGMYGTLEGE